MVAEHKTPTIDASHMDPAQLLGVIQLTQQQQGAHQTAGSERQSRLLDLKGFDNIETLSGGEEQWQNWSWKIKTIISVTSGELAEMLHAAERTGI